MVNILLIFTIWICTKQYGAYGYPYGIIIINTVNYFAMFFICKKLVPQINYSALLKYTGLIILVNAVIAAALCIALNYSGLNGLFNLISGFLLYLISLLIINKQFKLSSETEHILKHVKQKFF